METVELKNPIPQKPEFTRALLFVMDYRDGKIGDEYASTSSLAQMIVDYNQQFPSTPTNTEKEVLLDEMATVLKMLDGMNEFSTFEQTKLNAVLAHYNKIKGETK